MKQFGDGNLLAVQGEACFGACVFQVTLYGTKIDPTRLALPLPRVPAIPPLSALHAAIRTALRGTNRHQGWEPFIINAIGSFEVN